MKPIKINLFTIFLLICMSSFTGCQKDQSPLGGEVYSSHEYTWEIDTLHTTQAIQVMMSGIWGVNENDVWMVGHSDLNRYAMWHWDGQSWENKQIIFQNYPHSFSDIAGFSKDNIWAVGVNDVDHTFTIKREFVTHFNGQEWKLVDTPKGPRCFSIHGNNPKNLFVGCDSGLVMQYDGVNWAKHQTASLARIYGIGGTQAGNFYATGFQNDKMPHDSVSYFFYKFENNQWQVIDNFIDYPNAPPKKYDFQLWVSPEGNIYSFGEDGVTQFDGNNWNRIFSERVMGMNGLHKNDIFLTGYRNNIYHFNGKDFHRYPEFDHLDISYSRGIWRNDHYVFIIARGGRWTYVIRGKKVKGGD